MLCFQHEVQHNWMILTSTWIEGSGDNKHQCCCACRWHAGRIRLCLFCNRTMWIRPSSRAQSFRGEFKIAFFLTNTSRSSVPVPKNYINQISLTWIQRWNVTQPVKVLALLDRRQHLQARPAAMFPNNGPPGHSCPAVLNHHHHLPPSPRETLIPQLWTGLGAPAILTSASCDSGD